MEIIAKFIDNIKQPMPIPVCRATLGLQVNYKLHDVKKPMAKITLNMRHPISSIEPNSREPVSHGNRGTDATRLDP